MSDGCYSEEREAIFTVHEPFPKNECYIYVYAPEYVEIITRMKKRLKRMQDKIWMEKIEQSCKRKIARVSAQTTPASRSKTSPKSIRLPEYSSPKRISPRKALAIRKDTNSLPTPPVSSPGAAAGTATQPPLPLLRCWAWLGILESKCTCLSPSSHSRIDAHNNYPSCYFSFLLCCFFHATWI